MYESLASVSLIKHGRVCRSQGWCGKLDYATELLCCTLSFQMAVGDTAASGHQVFLSPGFRNGFYSDVEHRNKSEHEGRNRFWICSRLMGLTQSRGDERENGFSRPKMMVEKDSNGSNKARVPAPHTQRAVSCQPLLCIGAVGCSQDCGCRCPAPEQSCTDANVTMNDVRTELTAEPEQQASFLAWL